MLCAYEVPAASSISRDGYVVFGTSFGLGGSAFNAGGTDTIARLVVGLLKCPESSVPRVQSDHILKVLNSKSCMNPIRIRTQGLLATVCRCLEQA